jgi:hypothetical protein
VQQCTWGGLWLMAAAAAASRKGSLNDHLEQNFKI